MKQAAPDALDATFFALADPTRRAILARLALGDASVAELAEPFPISQPAVSKHLKILERAGLISVGRDAQRHPRRLEGQPLAVASEWLEQYRAIWEANFERLDLLLEQMQHRSAAKKPARPGKRAAGANHDKRRRR
jgi:DNA-binding transcriptional ArsR family regulator